MQPDQRGAGAIHDNIEHDVLRAAVSKEVPVLIAALEEILAGRSRVEEAAGTYKAPRKPARKKYDVPFPAAPAMHRAAQRAREVARLHGTPFGGDEIQALPVEVDDPPQLVQLVDARLAKGFSDIALVDLSIPHQRNIAALRRALKMMFHILLRQGADHKLHVAVIGFRRGFCGLCV